MKKIKTTLKTKWTNFKAFYEKHKCKIYSTAMAVTALVTPSCAMAADAKSVAKGAIDVVVKLFPFVGGFFVVAGAFKLFMAYRNNNPEDQAGAAKDIVIGGAFIAFSVLWSAVISGLF